ncbi:MAG: DUF362 domain-containing protein, partial [Chloroflexi bacterium]
MLDKTTRPRDAVQRTAATVALVRTAPQRERVFEDVQRAMELAHWHDYITAGAEIALKPNLGWDKLIPGAISAPWVVEGVIIALKDYAGKLFMVESNQVVVNVEKVFRLSGMADICRRHNIPWVNMSRGQFVRMRDPERLVLKDVHLPEILTRTELITLPLLKTHNKTTLSGAIKNQWGCLETLRHNFHPVLPEALVDLNTLVRPRFAVMDGTVGLEGDGPKSGRPKEMNVILASANLVGIDSVAARIMGFDPSAVHHLTLCAQHGLGSLPGRFALTGDPVESVAQPFVPAAHNAVSGLEMILRQSFVERLIFKTPLLWIPAWGARRYYDLWDWRVGRKLRREFFARS